MCQPAHSLCLPVASCGGRVLAQLTVAVGEARPTVGLPVSDEGLTAPGQGRVEVRGRCSQVEQIFQGWTCPLVCDVWPPRTDVESEWGQVGISGGNTERHCNARAAERKNRHLPAFCFLSRFSDSQETVCEHVCVCGWALETRRRQKTSRTSSKGSWRCRRTSPRPSEGCRCGQRAPSPRVRLRFLQFPLQLTDRKAEPAPIGPMPPPAPGGHTHRSPSLSTPGAPWAEVPGHPAGT